MPVIHLYDCYKVLGSQDQCLRMSSLETGFEKELHAEFHWRVLWGDTPVRK